MRRTLNLLRQQALGALALAIVLGGAGYAATGGNLKLGQINNADKKTTVKNTGNGPVLDLQAKAGQPGLKVNTTKQIPNLNASLLQGKKPADFATAGAAYTKAESDAKYADEGSSYTKAQSDAKYALVGSGYTKTEADARFGRILVKGDFAGTTPNNGSSTTAFTQSVAVPSAGVILVMVDTTSASGTDPILQVFTNGGVRFGSGLQNGSTGGTAVESVDAAGNVLVEIKVYDSDANSIVSVGGNIVIAFFPM